MKEEVELEVDDCAVSRVHSVARGRFERSEGLLEIPDRNEVES